MAHVFHRQEVAVFYHHPAVGIHEVIAHPAHLGTLATVCRATEKALRGIALTRIAHAERAMHEDLELHFGHGLVDGLYLIYRQLPGQHRARETEVAKPRHLFRRAVAICVEA